MNLWAKSLRQLLFVTVALFFFSCEDENSVLGIKNPNPKFNVAFVDIPLTSSVQLIDSLITDLGGSTSEGAILVGRYNDAVFGNVSANAYLRIGVSGSTPIPRDAIFDSLTFNLRFNYYDYGFSGKRTEKFTVHEIAEPLSRTSGQRYYYNSALNYNATPMASASVIADSEIFRKEYAEGLSAQDTLETRGRLDNALGLKIFNLAQAYSYAPKNSSDTTFLKEIDEFYNTVKGLALIPQESSGILGLRILNSYSGVTLHYRTVTNGAVADTVTRFLGFSTPSYTNIKIERSGALAGLQPYQSAGAASVTGARYVQSGVPVVTKLDLSNFYQFADTVGPIIINEASLLVGGVQVLSQTPPVSKLALKPMEANNQFSNYNRVETDRAALVDYVAHGVLLRDTKHYFVASDLQSSTPSIATLNYSDGQYSGYVTLLTQQLVAFRNKNGAVNDTRMKYIGLYPVEPNITSSVHRSVFAGEAVKLRIYYTKPTLTTTP